MSEASRSDQYFHTISEVLTGVSNKFSGEESYQRHDVDQFIRNIVAGFLVPVDIEILPLDTCDFRYLPLDHDDMELLVDSYFGADDDSVNYYLAEMICGELDSGYVDDEGVPMHRSFRLVNCAGDYIAESFSLSYAHNLAENMGIGTVVIAPTPAIIL